MGNGHSKDNNVQRNGRMTQSSSQPDRSKSKPSTMSSLERDQLGQRGSGDALSAGLLRGLDHIRDPQLNKMEVERLETPMEIAREMRKKEINVFKIQIKNLKEKIGLSAAQHEQNKQDVNKILEQFTIMRNADEMCNQQELKELTLKNEADIKNIKTKFKQEMDKMKLELQKRAESQTRALSEVSMYKIKLNNLKFDAENEWRKQNTTMGTFLQESKKNIKRLGSRTVRSLTDISTASTGRKDSSNRLSTKSPAKGGLQIVWPSQRDVSPPNINIPNIIQEMNENRSPVISLPSTDGTHRYENYKSMTRRTMYRQVYVANKQKLKRGKTRTLRVSFVLEALSPGHTIRIGISETNPDTNQSDKIKVISDQVFINMEDETHERSQKTITTREEEDPLEGPSSQKTITTREEEDPLEGPSSLLDNQGSQGANHFMNEKPPDVKLFKCTQCPCGYKQKESLLRHIRLKHPVAISKNKYHSLRKK